MIENYLVVPFWLTSKIESIGMSMSKLTSFGELSSILSRDEIINLLAINIRGPLSIGKDASANLCDFLPNGHFDKWCRDELGDIIGEGDIANIAIAEAYKLAETKSVRQLNLGSRLTGEGIHYAPRAKNYDGTLVLTYERLSSPKGSLNALYKDLHLALGAKEFQASSLHNTLVLNM